MTRASAIVLENTEHGDIFHVFGAVEQSCATELVDRIFSASSGRRPIAVDLSECLSIDPQAGKVISEACAVFGDLLRVSVGGRTFQILDEATRSNERSIQEIL